MWITWAGALLSATVFSLQPSALQAVCCTDSWLEFPTPTYMATAYCDDGAPTHKKYSPTWAQCSVGKCNFFGCDCDGGCRTHRSFTVKDLNDDSKKYDIRCKGDMMEDRQYTLEELIRMKEACGCFGPFGNPPIVLSEYESVEGPEEVVSSKLYCRPGHGACVLEIEHIKSFTVTTGFEVSTTVDLSKVIPASVTLTAKTDWAHETGTSIKYQCQAKEGHATWISIRPRYYKVKTLGHSGWHTRGNGETPEQQNIPVCNISYVYLPRTNSQNSIAGDMYCNAEKLKQGRKKTQN